MTGNQGRDYMAKHRFARITARKAGRIADMIRGRSVNEALELLQFTPNRGASFYMKVVKSAVANASMDESVNVNRLYICDARADVGPCSTTACASVLVRRAVPCRSPSACRT
jgi:large subunit ribosomal protein L22